MSHILQNDSKNLVATSNDLQYCIVCKMECSYRGVFHNDGTTLSPFENNGWSLLLYRKSRTDNDGKVRYESLQRFTPKVGTPHNKKIFPDKAHLVEFLSKRLNGMFTEAYKELKK